MSDMALEVNDLFARLTIATNSPSNNHLDAMRDSPIVKQLRQLYTQCPEEWRTVVFVMVQLNPQFGHFIATYYSDLMDVIWETVEYWRWRGRFIRKKDRMDIFWPDGINYGERITVSLYGILEYAITEDDFDEVVFELFIIRKHKLKVTEWAGLRVVEDGRLGAEIERITKRHSSRKPEITVKRGDDMRVPEQSDDEDEDWEDVSDNDDIDAVVMDVDGEDIDRTE